MDAHLEYASPLLDFSPSPSPSPAPSSSSPSSPLSKESSKLQARTGSLKLTSRDGHHQLSCTDTPALLTYTRKGAPLHISPDNVGRLPIEMVSLSFEHLLDYNPPLYSKAPFSLHHYLGLASSRRLPLFGMLRDPSDLRDMPSNTDRYVLARGFRGTVKVTPEHFPELGFARPPDVLLAVADEPLGGTESQKRITKSLARSEKWLSGMLSASQTKTNIIAPMVGSSVPAARAEYTQSLLAPPSAGARHTAPLIEAVLGVSININSILCTPPSREHMPRFSRTPSDSQLVFDCVSASLTGLPKSKFRLALCPNGPHEILRLVRDHGMDIFLDEWTSWCGNVGIALDFCFPASKNAEPRQLGYNLFDGIYATQFDSLAAPGLMVQLGDAFGDEALGDRSTKAYVHHLLHSHEMTAHVLLAMHNTCVMQLFMRRIRESIESGSFNQECESWLKRYDENLEALELAQLETKRVRGERGKGRLKGLGQERKEETGGSEAKESTSFDDMSKPV